MNKREASYSSGAQHIGCYQTCRLYALINMYPHPPPPGTTWGNGGDLNFLIVPPTGHEPLSNPHHNYYTQGVTSGFDHIKHTELA